MAEEMADESLLHVLRQFARSAKQSVIFKNELPSAPTLPAHVLDFRFAADNFARPYAITPKIINATVALLGEESGGIENRSLTPVSADLSEEDNPSNFHDALAPAIEATAEQAENSYAAEERPWVLSEVTAEEVKTRSTRTAAETSKLVFEELCQIEGFPKVGIDVTVYGFGAGWNAMLTFSPGSTTVSNAMTYRKLLPSLVAELRKHFELI